jgi:hypothetical protein
MKFFSGLAVIILGLTVSAVAAYFSIVGLAALFAGAATAVIIMGASLEAAKLMSAAWLHANWHNPAVSKTHRSILTAMVAALMLVTSLGIYGFLARGHLEQEAPLAATELKIAQFQQQIDQLKAKRQMAVDREGQLDKSANTLLGVAKTTKEAKAAAAFDAKKAKERTKIEAEIGGIDTEINKLTDAQLPLKMQTADVAAKLGPIRYVASLVGWKDPTSAVQAMILLIMFAFDPLAVVMVLSGSITLSQWAASRQKTSGKPSKVSSEPEDTPSAAEPTSPASPPVLGGIPVRMPIYSEKAADPAPAPVDASEPQTAQEPQTAASVPAEAESAPAAFSATLAAPAYSITAAAQDVRLGNISLNGAPVTPVPMPVMMPHVPFGDRKSSIAVAPGGPMPDPQDKGWLAVPRLLRWTRER